MSCKIFVVLAVLLTISKIGSALKCNRCHYQSTQPKDEQKCGSRTENCSTGYCYSVAYTRSDGISVVNRGCDDNANDRLCPDGAKTCERKTKETNLKSCVGICCSSDNCNNYTPNSAPGVMAAKFILCLMVIVGYFLA
ncbi:Hypothetical predicted protein [Paramuricea clavata]|uniref:Uncharacterized protein n=1 Tax=Paramuricea clavata TaxID=317549 RepID=A0A7D9HV93_PARCT|nr:Hypothetical predicted protein [Paramuricea clavata]